MSTDIDVKSSQWKQVEVGRVVLFTDGPYSGRLAAIVEIVDHKRVLVDGPSKDLPAVPRHSAPLANAALTPIVITKLPRGARSGALSKAWEKHEVEKKWKESSWAKTRLQRQRRRNLTDFERFKVMRLRKQARYEVRRAHASIRKAA